LPCDHDQQQIVSWTHYPLFSQCTAAAGYGVTKPHWCQHHGATAAMGRPQRFCIAPHLL